MNNTQVSRKDLLNIVINQKANSVEVKEITMQKGQSAPKHKHPCPVVGYIKSGSVLFQIEGEEKMIIEEGNAFYEPKNRNILHFDNASEDQPMVFVAFYLKEGDEENIVMVD